MQRKTKHLVDLILKNAEKCAYSRYRRPRYSRERAIQSLAAITTLPLLGLEGLGEAAHERAPGLQGPGGEPGPGRAQAGVGRGPRLSPEAWSNEHSE